MEILSSTGSILLIILGFGFLIFIHELGHFLAAKWAGIRTEGFAVGMGPVMVSWRQGLGTVVGSSERKVKAMTGKLPAELSDEELARHGLGETEYSLRWLPIGGFVKMLGQEDTKPIEESDDPRSYASCPIGKRMVVVSAGVIMNVLLALVLFVIAFLAGVRFDAPVIGDVRRGSPAHTTIATNADALGVSTPGVRPGDKVLEIGGDAARTFNDVQIHAAMSKPGEPLDLLVQRDGVAEPLFFPIVPEVDPVSGLLSIGVAPARSTRLFGGDQADDVAQLLDEAGLGASGVAPGMVVVSAGGETVTTYGAFADIVSRSTGRPVPTVWMSGPGRGDAARVDVDVPVRPVYQRMVQRTDGAESAEFDDAGLLGFSPLTRISSVGEKSDNRGILEAGDIVLRIAAIDAPRSSQFRAAVQERAGDEIEMIVLRDGKRETVRAEVSRKGLLGILITHEETIARTSAPVDRVYAPGKDGAAPRSTPTPAAALSLLPGTALDAVNDVPIDGWRGFRETLRAETADALAAGGGATLKLRVTHPTPGAEQEVVDLVLSPADVEALHDLGWACDLSSALFEPVHTVLSADGNPITAVMMGFAETHKMIMMTYLTIDRLFRGSVGVKQLHGPVGIIDLGSKILPRGFMYFLFFLGIISVNLAVINFLPLPIVDGGLFLFLIYEKIKGRPPSVQFQNVATVIGLCLIGTVFLVTFYNDIMRLL